MFKLPGYFTGFSSKSDGSAGLRFSTQELAPDDFANLKRAVNAFGWILFAEAELSEKDIPSEAIEEDGISASERLRRRMFVYWKQKVNEGDFDLWRRQQMEALGQRYLDKLT